MQLNNCFNLVNDNDYGKILLEDLKTTIKYTCLF